MVAILLILHVLICIFLVLVVLLQSSKGSGLAGAFGGGGLGGSMGAVFGGRGAAPFLSKATTVLAIAFLLSCIVHLKVRPVSGRPQRSILQQEAQEKAKTVEPGSSLPLINEEAPPPAGSQSGTATDTSR